MSRVADARAALALVWSSGRGPVLGLAVALTATATLPLLSALFLRAALDALVAGGDPAHVLGPIVAVGLTGVAAWAATPVRAYLGLEIERRVGLRARDRLYRAVGGQTGLARLEDPEFLDRLSIAEGAGVRAPVEIAIGLADLVQATVLAVGFVVTLARLNPVLSLVVLAAAGPAAAGQLAMSRRRVRLLAVTAGGARRELFFGSLLTDVHAALEIRLFGLADFFRTRMLDERRGADARRRRVDRQDLRVQVSFGVLAAVVAGAGLVWAGLAAARHELSVGDIAFTVAAIAAVQAALGGCVSAVAGLQTELGAYAHFRYVVGQSAPVDPGTQPCPPLRDALVVRDVWFRYADDGPWVLRGVDLRIDAGAAVGVVGANGAGKSTLIKLLARMYEPTRGTIEWDGVDIRRYDVEALRRRLGAVFQDFTSYDLTAAENIGLGDLAGLDDRPRIEQAGRMAGVDEPVRRLSAGYDTLLSRLYDDDGGAGVYLSGGQWQRVAVARALMRADVDVMVLDEPSSGLDPAAEASLNAQLRAVRRGRTTVLVSHRLSALRQADTIVVLDGGRVVEQGGHDALYGAGGRYATLFRAQAAGYLPA